MESYKKILLVIYILSVSSLVFANKLIDNGDFEVISAKKDFPARWFTISKGGSIYSKDTNNKIGGKHCFLFNQKGELTRIESRLTLKAGRKYRLTADMKTYSYQGAGGIYITPPHWNWSRRINIPQGSTNWKKYSLEFSLPDKQEKCYRLILFSKKNSHGKVWFDNLKLEEIIPTQIKNTVFISAGLISEPPVIDGNLNDKCWKGTLEATPFVKNGKYKFSVLAFEQSGVRIAYDRKNIYFAFTCQQQCLEPARNSLDDFRCNMKKHDGKMWDQDCVVLLFKTANNDSFYEVIVNGSGTITDAICKGPDYWTSGRSVDWESNARAAVKIDNGKWTTEVAIPLKKLNLSANIGLTFKACLGRLNIASNESSVYFPMRSGFHTPKYFGYIKLGSKLPEILNLNIGALNLGRNIFKFQSASYDHNKLKLDITTMDTTLRKYSSKKIFKLNPIVKRHSVDYFCRDQDYSLMQFTFSDKSGIFWQSPCYNKQNKNQEIAIQLDAESKADVSLNNLVMNRTTGSKKTKYKISCEPGIYETKGLTNKFTLSSSGFTSPTISGSKKTKILIATTKFWPENNNQFYIAENSIQPLHVVLHNPYRKLKNSTYSLNLAIPEELILEGATAAYKRHTNLSISKMKKIVCNGKNFKHFKFTIPNGLQYKTFYAEADGITILLKLPKSGKSFKTRQTELYAWSEFDDALIVEAPQKIGVNILPPLKGQIPQHFITQIWGGRMVNLNNRELARKFIRETIAGSGFNDLQSGSALIGNLKMTSFSVLNFRHAWGKEIDKLLKKNPEYTLINYLGKQTAKGAYNRICSTILLENKNIHEMMFQAIRHKYKYSTYINVDWEFPVKTGPISCYCKRCLERFKKSANIPANKKINSKIISKKFRQQWMHFMNKKLAAIIGIIQKQVHKAKRKMTFYSGYQSNKTLDQYGVDWKLAASNTDYALCGYNTSTEIIRNTISALANTPLITGVLSTPHRLVSREPSRQIDKAYLIKGIVLGSKGYLCYNIPQLDGRSYYAFSETAAMLREYEDIIYFGKINNDWLTLAGVDKDHYALFERSGSNKKILIIYNEDIKKTVKFKAKMKGNYKIYDYFSKKDLPANKQLFKGTVAPLDFNTYCIEKK